MAKSESKWQVLQRCLAILQRLHQGPADRIELMRAVRELVIDPYGDGSDDAQRKRFDRDIESLRTQLFVQIDCPLPEYRYRLTDSGPLIGITLSDRAMHGLAFLLDTFNSENDAANIVTPLFDEILNLLPSRQQEKLTKFDTMLDISLQRLDIGTIAPSVWEKVRAAVQKRRLLRFAYIARRHEDRQPRVHTVEPYTLRFFRGHYELKAYCRHWLNPQRVENRDAGWFRYRLDQIQADTIEILSDKLPPGQRKQRLVTVRYLLSPTLVRGGISQYFEDMRVAEPNADGWVEVLGKTDDLFEAERIFLAYGEHCVVLGPSELAHKMQRTVQEMARLYQIS